MYPPRAITGRATRGPVGLGLGAALTLVLAACSRPVTVPAPSPTATQLTAVCAALASQLPSEVDGSKERITDPQTTTTAAWGSPPITLRCGVPRPAGLTRTSELITINGVDWYPEQLSAGYRFTTTGRVANVEVSVPDTHKPETNALVDLAAAVAASDPTNR
ncbi:MAG: DUF3515 domain-containing protein [Candidatus Nanopelagicales bacterium]